MNILQVNDNDIIGGRFNGYKLVEHSEEYGVRCFQAVIHKRSKLDGVFQYIAPNDIFNELINFEKENSIRCLALPFAQNLIETRQFKDADIVHYHLIHNNLFSIFDFPRLARLKPSVWTIHDPWCLTGHCVYPIDCEKYLSGCNSCPNLERAFPITKDNASLMWSIKREIFNQLDIDIVVASDWMKKLIQESPLTSHFKRIHKIPFGINLETFSVVTLPVKLDIRRKLHIPNTFTLFFRASRGSFKGTDLILKSLERLGVNKQINILTVGEVGLLKELSGKENFNIVEFGWLDDERLLSQLYSASDLFLMPSKAESFGVMAVESLACGVPVVVMEGTSLPEIVTQDAGFVFKNGDIEGLVELIKYALENPIVLQEKSKNARKLAEVVYDEKIYLTKLVSLYDEIYRRNINRSL